MTLISFGMRKFTVRSATADMLSRLSCIDISLLTTVTVTVLVHVLDTWTYDALPLSLSLSSLLVVDVEEKMQLSRGVACAIIINVPDSDDPDDPNMDLSNRIERNSL